jgi:hypothetical protein
MDNSSATFNGTIGGNQVVFANRSYLLPSPINTEDTETEAKVEPFLVLEAYYEKESSNNTSTVLSSSISSTTSQVIHYKLVRRWIHYYEVSILSNSTSKVSNDQPTFRQPCVAMGLGSSFFPDVGYLPGWVCIHESRF